MVRVDARQRRSSMEVGKCEGDQAKTCKAAYMMVRNAYI